MALSEKTSVSNSNASSTVNAHHVSMLDKWQKICDHLGRIPMDYHGSSWMTIITTLQSIEVSHVSSVSSIAGRQDAIGAMAHAQLLGKQPRWSLRSSFGLAV